MILAAAFLRACYVLFPGRRLVLALCSRRVGAWPARDGRGRDHRHARLQRLLRGGLGGFRELHGPGGLLRRVDLEEAGLVEAASEAIIGAADRKLLISGAHEGLARPFATAIVVDRVDVIETRHERAAQQGFAIARRKVPPAFGGPGVVFLVAERNADAARGVVAKAKVRSRGFGPKGDRAREECAGKGP